MNSAGPARLTAFLTSLEQKASPAPTALVVVDEQNDFVADGGSFDRIGADVKSAQQSVPNLVRLVDHARAAGVLVVFVRSTYDAQYLSEAMRERNQRREMSIAASGESLPIWVIDADEERAIVRHVNAALRHG